jgi:hypothetical protein
MDNLIESQITDVVSNMVVGAIKSLARHNKTAAALLIKAADLDKRIKEHNEFLDDIIDILRPVAHIAHSILAKFLPGYVHIVDWVIELCQDVYNGVTAPVV